MITGGKQSNTLLVVDDDSINREILKNLFSSLYEIEEAENGKIGCGMIQNDPNRYCAVFLDVMMPEMDGLQVLHILDDMGITETLPIFLITAHAADDVVKQAYDLGVMDVISKPVVPYVVLRRVQSVVELFNARRSLRNTVIEQQTEISQKALQIINLSQGMLEALSTAIEFRDGESGEHVTRIRKITEYLLKNTKMGNGFSDEEIDNIAIASVMHDVGKIAIPDAILNKPARLTKEEFEIMKTHTVKGAELLEKIPQLKNHDAYMYACDIAMHHHERWDGRGYPDGLKGDEISVWAQIVALADVYDALTSERVYKKAFDPDVAVRMIANGECGTFNPELLECFFEAEPEIRELCRSLKGERYGLCDTEKCGN